MVMVLACRLPMLALGLVVVCSSGTQVMATTRVAVRPAKFTDVPQGWRAFDQLGGGYLDRRGADANSYALSWAYKPNLNGWANAMPPNAIAVQVILLRRDPAHPAANLCSKAPRLAGYPTILHLPLTLPKVTHATQEGQPNIPEYRMLGRLDNQYSIDLRVDINRAHPTPAMLRLAQRIVSRLYFPRWPLSAAC
jgi:hypothetical protein